MNKFGKIMALACAGWLIWGSVLAADLGSKDEAVALVKKAVAALKANGKDKTLAQVSEKGGPFADRDLYISVYDSTGKVLAHGANARLIGKDVSELKDADGKEFVKDILGKAKAGGKGTSEYKWPNSVTNKIELKTVYFEKSDDLIFSSGYVKQ